eukprot:7032965-Prorocentrum_lima.AAC.1
MCCGPKKVPSALRRQACPFAAGISAVFVPQQQGCAQSRLSCAQCGPAALVPSRSMRRGGAPLISKPPCT